ncbi:uncharacterized protein LOC124496834 [Dermatophagoides farinae]|uniref:Uncharacterized protein n=1 Tax=Dermatophagoides farinae TaxID=6954 RepID=A0A922L194_DERFA|nr:hypothetical protein DERF_011949 [Dermatophagoides farinae]
MKLFQHKQHRYQQSSSSSSSSILFIIFFIIVIWSSMMIVIIDTKIAYIIKIAGKKGAGNDVFVFGGKNCNTPNIIVKGHKKRNKRGKIIIVEDECKTVLPAYDYYRKVVHPFYGPAIGYGR